MLQCLLRDVLITSHSGHRAFGSKCSSKFMKSMVGSDYTYPGSLSQQKRNEIVEISRNKCAPYFMPTGNGKSDTEYIWRNTKLMNINTRYSITVLLFLCSFFRGAFIITHWQLFSSLR